MEVGTPGKSRIEGGSSRGVGGRGGRPRGAGRRGGRPRGLGGRGGVPRGRAEGPPPSPPGPAARLRRGGPRDCISGEPPAPREATPAPRGGRRGRAGKGKHRARAGQGARVIAGLGAPGRPPRAAPGRSVARAVTHLRGPALARAPDSTRGQGQGRAGAAADAGRRGRRGRAGPGAGPGLAGPVASPPRLAAAPRRCTAATGT